MGVMEKGDGQSQREREIEEREGTGKQKERDKRVREEIFTSCTTSGTHTTV
jgi:hypothetical protein